MACWSNTELHIAVLKFVSKMVWFPNKWFKKAKLLSARDDSERLLKSSEIKTKISYNTIRFYELSDFIKLSLTLFWHRGQANHFRNIHKLRWQVRGRGLPKCQQYYISLFVNDGGRGWVKHLQNSVYVVFGYPLLVISQFFTIMAHTSAESHPSKISLSKNRPENFCRIN